jgi:hypothetical protein
VEQTVTILKESWRVKRILLMQNLEDSTYWHLMRELLRTSSLKKGAEGAVGEYSL